MPPIQKDWPNKVNCWLFELTAVLFCGSQLKIKQINRNGSFMRKNSQTKGKYKKLKKTKFIDANTYTSDK